jgi:hypothetical protein
MHLFFNENSSSFLRFKDGFWAGKRKRGVKRLKIIKHKIAFSRFLKLFLQGKRLRYDGFEFRAGLWNFVNLWSFNRWLLNKIISRFAIGILGFYDRAVVYSIRIYNTIGKGGSLLGLRFFFELIFENNRSRVRGIFDGFVKI